MPEFVSYDEIPEIIRINRKIVRDRNESFGVEEKKIYDIINSVNVPLDQSIFHHRERIVKRASIMLARITWEQPFNNGNKATALYFTIQFLKKNKFDLLISGNPTIQNQIFHLLEDTALKFEGENIIDNVFKFLNENVIDFKFTDL
jgi:prophage maintenance system killer protein